MAYMVIQESGNLVDLSKLYTSYRINGDMEKALEVFRKATGDTRELKNEYGCLPTLDSVYWIFNADMVIKSHTGITEKEMHSIFENNHSDKSIAIAICNLAAKKNGGIWRYYWEY